MKRALSYVVVAALSTTAGAMLPKATTFPPERGECLILPLEVIDGDTVRFAFLVEESARLHGINAPERGDVRAKTSKQFLANIIPRTPCRAELLGREKYGRLLVRIYTPENSNVSELMIRSGHAVSWDGKGKRP